MNNFFIRNLITNYLRQDYLFVRKGTTQNDRSRDWASNPTMKRYNTTLF